MVVATAVVAVVVVAVVGLFELEHDSASVMRINVWVGGRAFKFLKKKEKRKRERQVEKEDITREKDDREETNKE